MKLFLLASLLALISMVASTVGIVTQHHIAGAVVSSVAALLAVACGVYKYRNY